MKNEKAFTLIEILIAFMILAMILSICYSILIATLNARDLIQKETEIDRIGSKLLSIIIRDFQSAHIYQVEGTSFSGSKNKVNFITNVDSIMPLEGITSDLCEVGYYLKPNTNLNGAYRLMRREDFFIDDKTLEGGYALKLYDKVTNFNLLYYNKKDEKKETWDSKEDGGMPEIIIIELSLVPSGVKPRNLKENIRTFKACIKTLSSSSLPKDKKNNKEKKE